MNNTNTAPQLQTASNYLRESPWLQEKRVSTLLKSVLALKTDFNTLEKELFTIAREHLIEMLAAVLGQLDNIILHSAERDGWEVVEIKERTLETTLGVLNYRRRYYKKPTISGAEAYAFLLDEILGLPSKRHISPRVCEISVALAAEQSYRKAAETLQMVLGVNISHESIRQNVQAAGEHIKKWDNKTSLDGKGQRTTQLIVIETDGVMLKQQRRRDKKRIKKRRSTKERFELKTAVIYEGWEEGLDGRGKLKKPSYFVHRGNGESFWDTLERHLSRIYDLDGCSRIIVAGDGDPWIREGADFLGAEYQYCRFHLKRELISLFGQQLQLRKKLDKIFKAADRTAFNTLLRTLLIEEKDEARRERIKAFQSLINSIWEGIKDWRERGASQPLPARGLGVIEPNVGHTIARRFKHQGASWSKKGADNLAQVRCAKRNGNLQELLHLATPHAIREKNQDNWARKKTEGSSKEDSGLWCQMSMPAVRGPVQKQRNFALLISRLTKDWLF